MGTLEGKGRDWSGSLEDPSLLQAQILRVLHKRLDTEPVFDAGVHEPHDVRRFGHGDDGAVSAAHHPVVSGVLLLVGVSDIHDGKGSEVCVILNKRSRRVRQAGDLCCPGGTMELTLDRCLAKLLPLPGFPLHRWPYWSVLRERRPKDARRLALLYATSLREGWEEMRLNPFGLRFLGPLPSERLVLFHRIIYPMVGWVGRQNRFVPSWEVEKIVAIPLRLLLDPVYYARFRIFIFPPLEQKLKRTTDEMPCFVYEQGNSTELLWGATYRIVMLFLRLVFGFVPPEMASLPIVPGILTENYVNGRDR